MQKTKKTYFFFINYFSKIFKTDLNYIFKGGSLLTITQLTSAIFGFLMTLAFANYLPQETFGIYKYILATYALLAIVSLPGIDTSLIETISKGYTLAFKNAVWVKLKWGLIGSICSIVFAFYNLYIGEKELFNMFVLISIYLPFMEAFSIYSSYYNGTKKYSEWTISEIINQIVSTTTLFLAIYFTNNIYVIVSTYFLTYILLRLVITIYIIKKNTFSENFDKEYINYGKTMSWYQIITRGINTIDQVLLFNITGPIALAVFSIANSIPTRVQGITKISGILASPKFGKQDEKEILKTLPNKMLYFGALLFLASICYAMIAPYLFKLLFPKYLDAIPYTQALIFYIVSGMTYPYGSYMILFKKIKEQYVMAFLNIISKVLCLVIFVPLYGIWGAIIGVLVSSYSTIFAVYYYIYRDRKILNKKVI